MLTLVFLVFFILYALGRISLRTLRWAYAAVVVLGLLYFPWSVGFRLNPQPCELAFDLPLAVFSLTNYAHVVLFALFFLMTSTQFRTLDRSTFAWAALATLVMGALVEIAEGVTGKGHCRLRDLIPDSAGALIGAAVLLLWIRIRPRLKPAPAR
ncbi:MAG: VanZ family protein [Acidobacteriota bacterium]|nr:VanZ family protein [Acidobacteriota bacterium]